MMGVTGEGWEVMGVGWAVMGVMGVGWEVREEDWEVRGEMGLRAGSGAGRELVEAGGKAGVTEGVMR